jgi:phosphate transport system permease protein
MRVPGGSAAAPGDRRGRALRAALASAAAVSVVAVFAIFVFLIAFALPMLHGGALGKLLSWRWLPLQGEFGILAMLAGSLCLGSSAMLLAFPSALALCAFAHGIGPDWAARPLRLAMRVMSSVPTVVYGLVSVFLLVPTIRGALGGSGFCWLAALLTLALLTLPTLVLIIDHAFSLAGAPLRLAAAALGMSPGQQLLHLVVPLSRRGLVAALALGFARAIGDTLIPLMLAGNAAQPPGSLLDPLRTLTSHIALTVAIDSQSVAYHSLFACGVFLFVFSLATNIVLQRLRTPGGHAHGA